MSPTDSQSPFPAAFVQRLHARDRGAWDEAFRRLWPVALRMARRILPPPPTDAEDVASATLAEFAAKTELPATWSECAALVSVMTRRRTVSHLRHQHRERRDAHRTQPLDALLAERLPAATDASLAALDLDTVLAELDATQRTILEAHFIDGLDSREIGERLQLNPATVRSHLFRCLQHLRRRWATRET